MPRWALALRLLGLGWYVAFCIVGGIAGGIWLDRKLDTKAVFLLLGVVAGSGLAFYGVYRMVAPLLRDGPLNGPGKPGA